MKKSIIISLVVIVLALTAAAFIYQNKNSSQVSNENEQTNPPPPPASAGIQPSPAPSQAPQAPPPPPSQLPPPPPAPNPTPSQTPPPKPPPPPPAPQPPPPQPPVQNYTIQADDYSATPSSITVSKGASVNLTFKVKTEGVYYGGLEFKSSVVNTGPIAPGASKTVNFTAQSSFDLQPYWPSSGVKKDYTVRVNVN